MARLRRGDRGQARRRRLGSGPPPHATRRPAERRPRRRAAALAPIATERPRCIAWQQREGTVDLPPCRPCRCRRRAVRVFLTLPLFMVLGSLRMPACLLRRLGVAPRSIVVGQLWRGRPVPAGVVDGGAELRLWSRSRRAGDRTGRVVGGLRHRHLARRGGAGAGRHQCAGAARPRRCAVGAAVHRVPLARTHRLAVRRRRAVTARRRRRSTSCCSPGVLADPVELVRRRARRRALVTAHVVGRRLPLGRSGALRRGHARVHLLLVEPDRSAAVHVVAGAGHAAAGPRAAAGLRADELPGAAGGCRDGHAACARRLRRRPSGRSSSTPWRGRDERTAASRRSPIRAGGVVPCLAASGGAAGRRA